jgi:hypothetical protein
MDFLSFLETITTLVNHAKAAGHSDPASVGVAAVQAMIQPPSTPADGTVPVTVPTDPVEANHIARLVRIANLIATFRK